MHPHAVRRRILGFDTWNGVISVLPRGRSPTRWGNPFPLLAARSERLRVPACAWAAPRADGPARDTGLSVRPGWCHAGALFSQV